MYSFSIKDNIFNIFYIGIEAAYKSLKTNIGTAVHTVFAVPMEVYEKTGTQGTVKAVVRAVPVAVLKPMIGASEAVSKTLLGLRNTIDPNQKLKNEDVGVLKNIFWFA